MSAIEATRLTIPEHIDTSGCVDLRRLSRGSSPLNCTTGLQPRRMTSAEHGFGEARAVVEAGELGTHRLHIYFHFEAVVPPAQNQAAQRAYITVIPTPCDRHMAVARNYIVGWIHVEPPKPLAICRNPGVGGICAYQTRPSRRWIGSQITADVPSREIDRAKAGDLQVGEILAHAATLLEDLFGWRSNGGDSCVEAKVSVDPRSQIDKRLSHRPSGCKRLQGVRGKLRP